MKYIAAEPAYFDRARRRKIAKAFVPEMDGDALSSIRLRAIENYSADSSLQRLKIETWGVHTARLKL